MATSFSRFSDPKAGKFGSSGAMNGSFAQAAPKFAPPDPHTGDETPAPKVAKVSSRYTELKVTLHRKLLESTIAARFRWPTVCNPAPNRKHAKSI